MEVSFCAVLILTPYVTGILYMSIVFWTFHCRAGAFSVGAGLLVSLVFARAVHAINLGSIQFFYPAFWRDESVAPGNRLTAIFSVCVRADPLQAVNLFGEWLQYMARRACEGVTSVLFSAAFVKRSVGAVTVITEDFSSIRS